MKKIKLLLLIFFLLCLPVKASDVTDSLSVLTGIVNAFTENDDNLEKIPSVKQATDKFMQANISIAWEDFYQIINSNISSAELISLSEKMAEFGFFDLSTLAKEKIKDKVLFSFYNDTVKEFYYPTIKHSKEEELFLAEIYSNIFYNDRPADAVSELLTKEELLKKSDYANYLLALGYYKSNNFKEAIKSINKTINLNPENINYQFLKMKLLAETGKRKEALKLFDNYNSRKVLPYQYRVKCELIKQFILYKTEKKQWKRNYYLGRYYYTEGDYQKALKSLQNAALSRKNADLAMIRGIMSRTYLKLGEDEKAYDLAQKSLKKDSSNKDACVTMARILLKNGRIEEALKYFKKASKEDKLDTSKLMVSVLYNKLGDTKKSKKIYNKIIKKGSDEWGFYYNASKYDSLRKLEYLKKTLSLNPLYKDAWADLVEYEISIKNYKRAEDYLQNLYYIDENDFRYYYYKGLIANVSGKVVDARRFLNKSLILNPNFNDAKKLLSEISKGEEL